MNHWLTVDPPDPFAAEEVNGTSVLLARARDCEASWGQLPNLVAVDFSTRGDLLEVVDVLNQVAPPAGLSRS